MHLYKTIANSVFPGCALYNVALRFLDVKIGSNVYFACLRMLDAEQVKIGRDALIEDGVYLNGHVYSGDSLRLSPLVIGQGAHVGRGCYLHCGEQLSPKSSLGSLSKLWKKKVPPSAHRRGLPVF
mmetsp:Transcript_3674/g.7097  ORF Transcript_3674/g.7097 Transcript_3674/m.7097 type:complete len:125 (-) Transcript_3674:93-467(-)